MTASESTRLRQQSSRQPETQGSGAERVPFKPSNTPAAALRSLQRAVGNRAVGRLMDAWGQKQAKDSPSAGRPKASGPGEPLSPDLRAEMESRFGQDLGEVRLHTGASAARTARAVQARAYTVGKDVVFGAGHFAPQTPSGKKLLAHELAHTIQQSRGGGETPSPLPDSPLEQEAERAANASPEGGPVQVQGASAPGIARQPLSLSSSMDPSLMSDEELEHEILEIQIWLKDNPGSSEVEILQDALLSFETEAASRIEQAPEPQPPPQPKAPPAPQISQDPTQAIRDVVQILNSIEPSPNASGIYTVNYEGQTYEIDELQRQKISEETRKVMRGGINSARIKANEAENNYKYTQEANQEFPVTSTLVEFFGGVDDPGPEVAEKVLEARVYANAADAAFKKGDYPSALEAMAFSEAAARRANALALAYREGLISAAETGKQYAATTRDVCLGISIGIGAIIAAPVVAAGVGTLATGAGLTGAAATGVTVLGTGATITTGGAVAGGTLRGGASVVGQALAGDEISAEETFTEIKEGAKQGAVAAASGWATAGTAGALGQGTNLAGQITRGAAAGSVGGATGGAVQGVLEGKSANEVLESTGKGALAGAVGGAFGGASSHLTGGSGALPRLASETVTGGAGGALSAAVTGGSAEEIKQAAILGAITGLGTSVGPGGPRPTRQNQQSTGKTGVPTQKQPPLPQIVRPQEIVGEPVRLPETSGAGPLLDPKGKPIGVIPPRRKPLVQVDEYGRPLPTPPRPANVPRLIDPSQPPPRRRGPRPVLLGPDERPLPPTQRQRSRPTRKKAEEKPKTILYGPDDKPLEGTTPPETPPKLFTGKPETPTPTGKPQLVDPSGQPIIPGARAKLEDPLLSAAEWQGGINARGLALERAVIQRRYPNSTELPPNFKAFDAVEGGTRTPQIERPKKGSGRLTEVIEGGKAISIKSADLNGSSYQNADGTYRSLSGYVDAIKNYPKKGYALSGPDQQTGQPQRVRVVNPSERVLHIELNQAPTQPQMEGLARLQFYGRQNNIEVIIVAPNSVTF